MYFSTQIAEDLSRLNRPLFITEWLHRPNGNTVETHLPFFSQRRIACYNWGFVRGLTQTHLSWDTMGGRPDDSPRLWQHDLIDAQG